MTATWDTLVAEDTAMAAGVLLGQSGRKALSLAHQAAHAC